jgi:hypothetical protein
MPSSRVPDKDFTSDYEDEDEKPIELEEYLLTMERFEDHTFDELEPKSLYELAWYFPAFTIVQGSWLYAYNLVQRHLEVPYLHSTVRKDEFSISDTQWELYFPLYSLSLSSILLLILFI